MSFLIFLIIIWIIFWIIPNRMRKYFLLAASIYFYGCFEWWYVGLLLLTTIIDFWAAQMMWTRSHQKTMFLWISIMGNILVLSVFKYGSFLMSIFSAEEYTYHWAIPVGLSFYTFQSMSYVIDVYRNKYIPNDSFDEFLLYVSFFPHMVAGPVVRYHSLMPQIKQLDTYSFKNIPWWDAFKWCVWGYFKKIVIADNLDIIVNPAYANISDLNAWETILAGFLFTVQVYCDFSGYSDIATGIARLFHINLSINWLRPFLSKSIKELWRRWHISVSTWFRDYLYFSLGGNKVNTSQWIINIMLTFVMSGLWHGANYTFIIWGFLHGWMFLIEHFLFLKQKWIHSFLGNIYLLIFHSISIIAVRCENLQQLSNAYSNFLEDWTFHLNHLSNYTDKVYWYFGWIMICLVFTKEILEESSHNKIQVLKNRWREVFYWLLLVGIMVFGNFHGKVFIYFQF